MGQHSRGWRARLVVVRAQAGGAEAVCWQLRVDWDGWQLRVRWWALQDAGWKLRFLRTGLS